MSFRVARLGSSFQYRSLCAREADGESEVPPEWFYGKTPVGERWPSPAVELMRDSCKSQAEPEGPSERAKPLGDFPHCWGVGINFGVLSKRALDSLHDLIQPYVEFLPLTSAAGEFTAFKVLREVDALDRERSEIEWFPQLKREIGKPRQARAIKRFAFHEGALADEVLFQLPEMSAHTHIFVTQEFINCVDKNGLTGFRFTDVWPPADPAIERQKYLAKRQKKNRRKTTG